MKCKTSIPGNITQPNIKPEPRKERNLDRHNSNVMTNRIYWNHRDLLKLYVKQPTSAIKSRLKELNDPNVMNKDITSNKKYLFIPKMCQRDLIYLTREQLIGVREILREEQLFLINHKEGIKSKQGERLSTRFYDNIEFVKSMLESIDRLYEESLVAPETDIASQITKWAGVALGVTAVVSAGICIYKECDELFSDKLI